MAYQPKSKFGDLLKVAANYGITYEYHHNDKEPYHIKYKGKVWTRCSHPEGLIHSLIRAIQNETEI